jgi:hypothetical protein
MPNERRNFLHAFPLTGLNLKTQSICSYSAFPPDSCNIPVPSSTPVTSSTSAPAIIQLIAASPPTGDGIGTDDADTPCGLFSLSIFCPLTFGGVLGRLLKAIFGF